MTGPENPTSIQAALVLAGRGECPDPLVLREAADELDGLRRELDAWREAHAAAVQVIDEQGAAVELLRRCVPLVQLVGWTDVLEDIDRVLAAIDNPEERRVS